MIMEIVSASATAPASVANVAVGFDVLGHAFDAAVDTVTAARNDEPAISLGEVTGLCTTLPPDVGSNTALAAASALVEAVQPTFGVRLSIDKGIPMSAGMGGSAASAVAAVAATNALLGGPYSLEELVPFALAGERVASDPPHWDNIVASLFGGLVLIAREKPLLIRRVTVPDEIMAVVICPSAQVHTREARALLSPTVSFKNAIEQNRCASSFFVGCMSGDFDLIRAGLQDLIVEPQRAHLFPPLPAVREAALEAGALGCSFSGSGPSIFAWAVEDRAGEVKDAMVAVLEAREILSTAYVAPVNSKGVQISNVISRRAL